MTRKYGCSFGDTVWNAAGGIQTNRSQTSSVDSFTEIYVVVSLAFNLFVSISRGKEQYPYSTKSLSMILHGR